MRVAATAACWALISGLALTGCNQTADEGGANAKGVTSAHGEAVIKVPGMV